jgi:hypothetical protein
VRYGVRVVQPDGIERMVGAAVDTVFPSTKSPVLTETGQPHVFASALSAAMWIDDFRSRGHERGYHCDIQDLDDSERGAIDPEADL